jgi:hypothetical protein
MKEKGKEWHKIKGTMQLFKNDKLIREYSYQHGHDRRRMYNIWKSEVKPNGIDKLELIIKPKI